METFGLKLIIIIWGYYLFQWMWISSLRVSTQFSTIGKKNFRVFSSLRSFYQHVSDESFWLEINANHLGILSVSMDVGKFFDGFYSSVVYWKVEF